MNTNTKDEFIKEILEAAKKAGIKTKVVKIEDDTEETGYLKVKLRNDGKAETVINGLGCMEILSIV